jgi:hypothetical protein
MRSASESFARYGGSASTLSFRSQKLTSGGFFGITLGITITDALTSHWVRASPYRLERCRQHKRNAKPFRPALKLFRAQCSEVSTMNTPS